MGHLGKVLRFGGPFLRRYLGRFVAGILLGVAFGLSNGLLLWAVNVLIDRMAGTSGPPALLADGSTRLSQVIAQVDAMARQMADPWLPCSGRPIDAWQIVGGVLLLPLLVAARGYLGFLSSYCLAWVSERVVNDLRVAVLERLSSLSLEYFHRSTTGDLITRVNTDTVFLQRSLNLGLSDLVKEPVTILSVFGGLMILDWRLTLAAGFFFPLCVIPIVVLGRKVRRTSKSVLSCSISQSSLLVEMIAGIRVVKAFGLETESIDRFRRLSREWIHHSLRGIRAKELMNPFIETISMLGLGLLIVYIAWRQHTVANMVTFLTGMAFAYTPIKRLAGLHAMFQQTSVGVDRLGQLLREQPTVRPPEHPQPIASFSDAIRFRDVDFSYGRQVVLQNISLEIPRGFRLGIAGESGSGKSTLINLLFRFYDPTRGSVQIDGRDLRSLALGDLRLLLALVSQEVVLFDLTVAENIAAGRRGATRAEVEAAARAAYAHDFIRQLPLGYDTRIGEQGVTLSGGQRQRLAIARAFVRNAPILVLDEATASLDSAAEAEVHAALDQLARHRTVVCVAHRLATLVNMDAIAVLHQGRLVEHGRFDSLLGRSGPFAEMARRQGITLPPSQAAGPAAAPAPIIPSPPPAS